MKASELIERLTALVSMHGDGQVDLLLEDFESYGQIESPLGDIVVVPGLYKPRREPEFKLLCEGFS